jgi:hypothetical protein
MNRKNQLIKTISFTLLFLLAAGTALAQSNLFEQGYVILDNRDTLFGYVKDLAVRKDLYLSVTFSDNQAGANPVIYSPYEVIEYYYEPGLCFLSREIEVKDESGRRFLQCLVKGYASLYYYETVERSGYLLEKEGEPLQFLEEQPDDPRLMDQPSAEKMRDFISGCPELMEKVKTLSSRGKDLIRLIRQYNRCSRADQEIVLYKPGKEKPFRVGVTAGINLSDLTVQGNTNYHDANLKVGMGFNLGVGFECYFMKRFSAEMKVMWVSYNASLWDYPVDDPDTTFREDDVLINFSYIDFPVQLRFNLNQNRIKTFVFGGFWYGILLEQDIAVQSTREERSGVYPLDLDRLKRGYTGGLGIAIPSSRRSEISFEIGYIYQKTGGGSSDGFTMNNVFLQMNYLF